MQRAWTCPPHGKTDPRAVPLGAATWAHIGALPAARDADAFLFPRYDESRGLSNLAAC